MTGGARPGRRRSAPRRPRPPGRDTGSLEQRGRSAERGSERVRVCAVCLCVPPHAGAAERGCADRGRRTWAAGRRVRRVLLAAISFSHELFNDLGVRRGLYGRGSTRVGLTRHIPHTDGAAWHNKCALSLPHLNFASNQAACMVGRVDIPTGVYKRQATSPFKPPPSRAVRALRAPPWPPPWPRPWPRPPPPPPLQP